MYNNNVYGVHVSALRITSVVSISIYEKKKTDIERLRFPELKAKSEPGNITRFIFPFPMYKTDAHPWL